MNVFEMEKEFNDLIKHGQELIEKLKQEISDDTMIGKLGWVSDYNPNDKKECRVLVEIKDRTKNKYLCEGDVYWNYFTKLTPEEIEQYTGYKVER